jgi:hypothetical protein
MRFLIIQNGLVNRETHYFGETLDWCGALARQGLEHRLYIGRRAGAEIVAALGAVACFPYAADERLPCEPDLRELHAFVRMGEAFARACQALEADGIGRDDVVLVPFSSDIEMHGLATWLRTLPVARRPRAAFVFHNPDFDWPVRQGRVVADGRHHRYARLELAEAAGEGRFAIWATTGALQQVLSRMMGHPCGLLPVPKTYLTGEALARGIAETGPWPPVDLAIMGQYRDEKGGGLIPRILAQASRDRPGLKAAVQVRTDEDAAALRALLTPIADRLELHLHPGTLEPAAYAALLSSADVILCPYAPARYVLRVSGVFIDALAYGKPVVVPDGSWMTEQLAAGHGAGISFAEFTVPSISRAVVTALDQRETLTRSAAAHQSRWRARHHVQAALTEILRQLGTPETTPPSPPR